MYLLIFTENVFRLGFNWYFNQIFQRHVLQNLQRFTKCEEHPLQYSQFRRAVNMPISLLREYSK